jgi:DNA end-binding protein Ku
MRALWSGALSFGLINIPIKLYSASEERALKFHLLDKHGNCPISYMKVCRGTTKEVEYKDIVKGYEYQRGDYVILTDEDFKKAAPKKTRAVDIVSFVDEKEVPSDLMNKPYFVEPDKKAEKAYVLLREALKRSKKVGIAKIVFRDKEHIAMVKPEDKALMLITLRYEDEMRKPEGLNLPGKADYSRRELDMALMLIDQLQEHFKASDYKDTYTEDLQKLIEKKAKGKTVRIEKDEKLTPTTDMRELMEMLKKSLEKEKRSSKKAGRRQKVAA